MHTIFVQCVEIQKVSQKRLQFLMQRVIKDLYCVDITNVLRLGMVYYKELKFLQYERIESS